MPKKHEIQFLEKVQSKIIDYLAEPQNNVQDINEYSDKPSLTKHLDLKTPTNSPDFLSITSKILLELYEGICVPYVFPLCSRIWYIEVE